MKIVLCVLGASLTVFNPEQASAQTLVEALTQAYTSNPQLRGAQWQVREAFEARKRMEAVGWLPSVSGRVSVGHSEARSYHIGGSSANQSTAANPLSAGVDVSHNLINPAEGNAGDLRAAQEAVDSAVADYVLREQSFLLSAIKAYLDYATALESYKVSEAQAKTYEQDHKQKSVEFNLGAAARTELSRVEARLAQARAALAKSEATIESARADYIKVFGSLPEQLEKPSLRGTKSALETLEQVVALAEKENPKVKQAQADLRKADASVQSSRARLLPSVSLEGTVETSRNGVHDEFARGDEPDYTHKASMMAVMRIPLYNPASYSQTRTQAIRQVEGRLGLEDTRRAVRKEAIAAFYTLKAAEAEVKQYEIAVKAAQDALKGTRLESEMGARTFLDVLLSESDLLNAQQMLLEAEQKHVLAFYDVQRVCGRLTPQLLNMKVSAFQPHSDYKKNANWLGFKDRDKPLDASVGHKTSGVSQGRP